LDLGKTKSSSDPGGASGSDDPLSDASKKIDTTVSLFYSTTDPGLITLSEKPERIKDYVDNISPALTGYGLFDVKGRFYAFCKGDKDAELGFHAGSALIWGPILSYWKNEVYTTDYPGPPNTNLVAFNTDNVCKKEILPYNKGKPKII